MFGLSINPAVHLNRNVFVPFFGIDFYEPWFKKVIDNALKAIRVELVLLMVHILNDEVFHFDWIAPELKMMEEDTSSAIAAVKDQGPVGAVFTSSSSPLTKAELSAYYASQTQSDTEQLLRAKTTQNGAVIAASSSPLTAQELSDYYEQQNAKSRNIRAGRIFYSWSSRCKFIKSVNSSRVIRLL